MTPDEKQQAVEAALQRIVLPPHISIRAWQDTDFPAVQRLSEAEGWATPSKRPMAAWRNSWPALIAVALLGLQDIDPAAVPVLRECPPDLAAQLGLRVVVKAFQCPGHLVLARSRRAVAERVNDIGPHFGIGIRDHLQESIPDAVVGGQEAAGAEGVDRRAPGPRFECIGLGKEIVNFLRTRSSGSRRYAIGGA